MGILLGATEMLGAYLGTTEIPKIYLGDILVYPTTPSPPAPTGYTEFLSSGELILPSGVTTLEFLVIGGGGAGGNSWYEGKPISSTCEGGSGGGGGFVSGVTLSPSAGTYQVIVGSGGTSSTAYAVRSTNGGNSSFMGITAYGGGAGANGKQGSGQNGYSGGSGGGASIYSYSTLCQLSGYGVAGIGVAGQGHNGWKLGGGGAGASYPTYPNGKYSYISGVGVYYSTTTFDPTQAPPIPAPPAQPANSGYGGYGQGTYGNVGQWKGSDGGSGKVIVKYY